MNCPNGHLTTSDDYCSVCGVKMSADPEPLGSGDPDKSQSSVCPKCQTTQLAANAQFCENCGHKLDETPPKDAASVGISMAAVQGSASPAPDTSHEPGLTPSDRPTGDPPVAPWRVECRVFKEAAPDETTPRAAYKSSTEIILKNQVTQIGRSSQKRNLHPEIACDWDDAVSHRHAKIELDPDGNAFLVDVGSTNGTMLNGQLISPDTPMKLKDGDRISLGSKTALIIHEPNK
ncbi:MAG TPA: FHA domain-containing protein [Chthoniobacterales bacterium]|nr:FHA domain-containing protein [Chthoniobacterales bacterium]